MSENTNEITDKDLIKYGFELKREQSGVSETEKIWTNNKLGIDLIPNGNGYLPKYCPPLRIIKLEPGQPPFSKDGKFILTLENLKELIEDVKSMRCNN